MMGLVGDLLGTHLEVSGELVVRSLTWSDNLPQVWGEEFIGLGDSSEGSLQDCMTEGKRERRYSVDCPKAQCNLQLQHDVLTVTLGSSGTLGLSVAILDTSHLQQPLGSWGSDDTSTTRSWDQSTHD